MLSNSLIYFQARWRLCSSLPPAYAQLLLILFCSLCLLNFCLVFPFLEKWVPRSWWNFKKASCEVCNRGLLFSLVKTISIRKHIFFPFIFAIVLYKVQVTQMVSSNTVHVCITGRPPEKETIISYGCFTITTGHLAYMAQWSLTLPRSALQVATKKVILLHPPIISYIPGYFQHTHTHTQKG